MLEKELNFADIIISLYNNYTHPEEKLWKDRMADFYAKLKVRAYCPLWEKQEYLLYTIVSITGNNKRVDEIAIQTELLSALAIIQLYTNIYVNKEIDLDLFTEEIYDAFSISNLYTEIFRIAGDDIISFKNMLYQSLNWSNLFNLVRMFEGFDMNKVDSLISEIKEARSSLDDEKLNMLKQISMIDRTASSDLSDYLNASIIKSLENVDVRQIEEWREKQNIFSNFDKILTQNTEEEIMNNIKEYFEFHSKELGFSVTDEEIKDVYKYLRSKNAEAMNKIDIEIAEENKRSIQDGMTNQMIKLLSKRGSLKRKYEKEEELIRLADTLMDMDNNSVDELKEILINFQKTKKQ